jgi:hypothetical protein
VAVSKLLLKSHKNKVLNYYIYIHIYCKIKGYLSLYEKKWVTKEWKELFVILCEVGLILFENPGD